MFILGMIVGMLVGLFVATVIYAVRWNFEHRERVKSDKALAVMEEKHEKLLMNTNPTKWLDESDVAVNIATKERLYHKHPNLVRPGTEVLRIESELVEDEASAKSDSTSTGLAVGDDPMERRI